MPVPLSYKEAGTWKKAEPRDDISKGNWYSVFHDEKLNELESQAKANNQNLRAAIARVSEARALSRQAEADFYPTLDFTADGSRQRTSPNNGQVKAQSGGLILPIGPGGSNVAFNSGTKAYTFNSAEVVPFDLSYEIDIWGKVRREFEAEGDQAQATLADFENVLLGLKSDVATNYFSLRAYDSQIDVQRRSIQSYKDELDLTNSRFSGGVGTQLDVEQAKAELASAQAQLASLQQSRAQVEHAIAVLVGQPPASFSIAFNPLNLEPPVIPPGLPSDLLERRPDVAAAERRVAAQNAQIGVAISAYFPVVRLTGQTGFDSGDLGQLFNWQSRIWSYGPSIQFPIFEGGRIEANIKQQRATYEENVANYRQQVLVAFQDVEDSLSALHYLKEQGEAENAAYKSYQTALNLTNDRYKAGLVSYYDVITAERSALDAEQLTVQIAGNRIGSTVRLIKAMGGGWGDSYITQPHHGNHIDEPSAAPTVLGSTAAPAVNSGDMMQTGAQGMPR